MIFSNKIYKIIDGKNPTLFQETNDVLNLYIFNNSLKKYQILSNIKTNCVFSKQFNYDKLIQISDEIYCPCNGEFITKINEDIL